MSIQERLSKLKANRPELEAEIDGHFICIKTHIESTPPMLRESA